MRSAVRLHAALRFCNEHDVVTTDILYEVNKPTLVDEMLEIRWKAQGEAQPPKREDLLSALMPRV